MLNCTGNTDCKIYVRTNCLTSLSNLKLFWKPSIIYYGTGAAYCTTDHISKILKDLEVLSTTYTTTTGYEDLSIHNIYGIRQFFNNIQDLNIFVVWCETRIVLNNLSLSTGNWINLLHNTRTNSCHLRTVVRASDCCDCVTTKCRTCHKKLVMLLLLIWNWIDWKITNLKYSTVSSKTCCNTCRNTRTKITTNCCCTNQNDFRLILIDDRS